MTTIAIQASQTDLTSPLNGSLATTVGRYVVADTHCECIVARPSDEPELWDEFLLGALRSYRKFGVERVLEYEAVRTGRSTNMFVAVVDIHDRVVGGVRVQGPYRRASQAHALVEWGGAPGSRTLRKLISSRVRDRMVEMKTGWVGEEAEDRHLLASAIARTPMHAMALTGARYALCTVADHAVRRWCSTGAQVSESVPAVAYPDDRYRTVPIWWDRCTVPDLVDPAVMALLADERRQLALSTAHRPEIFARAA